MMKSGSGRVWVQIFGFGLQSSGFYRVITLGFSGFAIMNVLNVGFRVGFDFIGFRLFPLGFRVPDFITM